MNEEDDFKKKFEEANPGIKLTERTKKKTIELTKRLKTSLGIMIASAVCIIIAGGPVWIYLGIPVLGLLGYFGYRPELDEE